MGIVAIMIKTGGFEVLAYEIGRFAKGRQFLTDQVGFYLFQKCRISVVFINRFMISNQDSSVLDKFVFGCLENKECFFDFWKYLMDQTTTD